MYPFVKQTPNGHRLACPKGHTDLILWHDPSLHSSIARQIHCPHCTNKQGSLQPVGSLADLPLFAARDSRGDPQLEMRMLSDMREYFSNLL